MASRKGLKLIFKIGDVKLRNSFVAYLLLFVI